MRAIVYTGAGGIEVIALRERPDPAPGPGQVGVRVRAAGLNRADVIQRRGAYPAPPGWPPDVPGLEFAGEVTSLGAGTSRWQVGDRVMGLVGGGAHAETVVVHEDEALVVPRELSFEEAAAIPEAFLTAYDGLVARARVRSGERVLVHAIGSGVGTAAVQLIRWLGGVSIGTSRSADKLAKARNLGLVEGILTAATPFREALSKPADVILDCLGAGAWVDNLAVLAPRGRLVLIGTLQGASAGSTDLSRILRGRLEVIGTVMRSRGQAERAALAQEFAASVLPLFDRPPTGGVPALRPVVGAIFPMDDLAGAHEAMEGNRVFGKIVLRW